MASLRYAIEQGCYASECDIYWTKDDNVVVAHADGKCQINGMHPWEHTLAELRAAGKLSNGEQLPSLEDFIKEVKKETCCTRLWLDIKNITYPATLTEHAIAATRRSCEIAAEMGAKHFVEFICTGNATVMKSSLTYARAAGIPIGWMNNRSAGEYATLGYDWANLAAPHMCAEAGGKGARTIEEFEKEGIVLSVYNIDRQAGDGNAVYASEAIDYYCQNAKRFKALCTNYPKWLIAKIEQAAKVYDGIRSEADLQAFAAEVVVDPTAKRFQNAAGAVVLHNDITVAGAWRPLADFTGVFDGNGKTLTVNYSGSDEQAGIFATLNGTVKNLRVAGSFTTAATAKVSLGAIAGVLGETAQIVGCVNTAAIAMDVDASGTTIIGGIFGKGTAGCVIADNTNKGTITVHRKTPSDSAAVGGVGGFAYSDVSGCVNEGEIRLSDEVSAKKAMYAGGVLGRLDAGKGYVVENCRNEAPVTLATAQVANNLLGGVVAYANGENNDTPNTIRNCENRGHVLADAPVSETANVGKARMGGICGGSAIFTSCTNYGAVEARGGGKGATEFAIGGISGMIAHDAADWPKFRRCAQQHRQGEHSGPYGRSVRLGDARLHDRGVCAGCRRGLDDALQLRRRQGFDRRPDAREQQLRGHSGRTHQVEDRGDGQVREDPRQDDAYDQRRRADQGRRLHDDGAGRQLPLRSGSGCGGQTGARKRCDHLCFDQKITDNEGVGNFGSPLFFSKHANQNTLSNTGSGGSSSVR